MSAPVVQDRSQRPRIVALGVIATLVLFITGALVAGNATAETTSDRVWVCKYVGTPGDGETLQTGNNPIGVSVNAIELSPVVIGQPFGDAQGRSFVIAFQQNPSDTYEGPACPTTPPGDGTPTQTETTPTGGQPSTPGAPVAAPTDLPSTQATGIAGLFGIALFLLGAAAVALRGSRQH